MILLGNNLTHHERLIIGISLSKLSNTRRRFQTCLLLTYSQI